MSQNNNFDLLANAGLTSYKAKRGESYMNENQLEHFRQILTAWKENLQQEIDYTQEKLADEGWQCPDENDRASREEAFSLDLRNRDRARKLMKKINKTLKRLEEDDYGFCDDCGDEIGLKRLEARPTADMCVDCKERAEHQEKHLIRR